MDNADRIPIDVGYDVAASADASDARTTVAQDGTVTIDILVQPPCDQSVQTDEIVVCAPRSASRNIPGADGAFTDGGFKPEIELAPNTKIKVQTETDPLTGADRGMVNLTYRF